MRVVSRTADQAGLGDLAPHDQRRTVITDGLNTGAYGLPSSFTDCLRRGCLVQPVTGWCSAVSQEGCGLGHAGISFYFVSISTPPPGLFPARSPRSTGGGNPEASGRGSALSGDDSRA